MHFTYLFVIVEIVHWIYRSPFILYIKPIFVYHLFQIVNGEIKFCWPRSIFSIFVLFEPILVSEVVYVLVTKFFQYF